MFAVAGLDHSRSLLTRLVKVAQHFCASVLQRSLRPISVFKITICIPIFVEIPHLTSMWNKHSILEVSFSILWFRCFCPYRNNWTITQLWKLWTMRDRVSCTWSYAMLRWTVLHTYIAALNCFALPAALHIYIYIYIAAYIHSCFRTVMLRWTVLRWTVSQACSTSKP